MIGALRGSILERQALGETAVELVVDVGGVGYRVSVTPRTAARLGTAPGEVHMSVHTHVREGAITLYGFADPAERRAFELLISAHGVGPALALAVLGVHRPAALAEMVVNGDVDGLCLVPGVGRKTAVRLLVDLKARFEQLDGGEGLDRLLESSPAAAGHRGAEGGPSPESGDGDGEGDSEWSVAARAARAARADVSEALAQLGYASQEIRAALRELPDAGTAEDLLRLALRELAPRR